MKLAVSFVLFLAPALAFKGSRRHAGEASMELPISRSSDTFLQLASDRLTLTSDGASGRHKIGGQFHEDRMKELQKVKHALIEMARQEGTDRAVPAGKSMDFYMSTVVEMINTTMRSSLGEQHEADKAVMALGIKQFDTCLSTLSSGLSWPNAILVGGSFAGEAYSGLDIDKKAHNDCRQTQNDKKLLYDTCVDDERMRWEAVKAACDDNFTKFYSSVSSKSTGAWQKQCDSQLEIFANTAPDADPSGLVDLGDQDTEGYLLAQFNFWDKKLEAYLTAEALCKKATAKAEAEKADCSSKLEDFFNISKQCDALQDSLDGLACQQALARHTKCSDYDTCFAAAESSWKTMKQSMCGSSGKEGVLQEEQIMIEQIECILSSVTKPDSTTEVAKCLNNPPKRSHTLLFPQCSEAVPAKNDIQNCGNHLKPADDADMPGTKPYVEKYYTGPESSPTGYPLPAVSEHEDSNHAPPVDVKACVATCCTKPPAAANNARGLDKRPQDCGSCGGLPCKYCDSEGCCSTQSDGGQCKKKNPYAAVTCKDERQDASEANATNVTMQVRVAAIEAALMAKQRGEIPRDQAAAAGRAAAQMARSLGLKVEEQAALAASEAALVAVKAAQTPQQQMEAAANAAYAAVEEAASSFFGPTADAESSGHSKATAKMAEEAALTAAVQSALAAGMSKTEAETASAEAVTQDAGNYAASKAAAAARAANKPIKVQVQAAVEAAVKATIQSSEAEAEAEGKGEGSSSTASVEEQAVSAGLAASDASRAAGQSVRDEVLWAARHTVDLGKNKGLNEPKALALVRHVILKVAKAHGMSEEQAAAMADMAIDQVAEKVCITPKLEGYDVTEESLNQTEAFSVKVACAPGFYGTPKANVCTISGAPYQVLGCFPIVCSTPTSMDGYQVTELSRAIYQWNVSAACDEYFSGTPKVTPCSVHNTPYGLTGCVEKHCATSKKIKGHGYDVTEVSTSMRNFEISVKCHESFKGDPTAHVCKKMNEPYDLHGCTHREYCVSPSSKKRIGYDVTEIDLEIPGLAVKASCSENYVGAALVEECDDDDGEYVLSGCEPMTCASQTASPPAGYKITAENLEVPDFAINVECAPGYMGTPDAMACNTQGGSYRLSGCEPKKCVAPKNQEGYSIAKEASLDMPTLDVLVACEDKYMGKAAAHACSDHLAEYSLSGCSPQTCLEPLDVVGYVTQVESLQRPSFAVTAKCARLYEGSPEVTACAQHDRVFTLAGCRPSVCARPAQLRGYTITEEKSLEMRSFNVEVNCAVNYTGTASVTDCSKADEPYTLHGCFPQVCTKPRKGATEGYVVTETSLERPSFQVSAACAVDYMGSPSVSVCGSHDLPFSVSGCQPQTCTEPTDAEKEGYTFTVASLTRPHFSVEVDCAPGYTGTPSVTRCSAHGKPYTFGGCHEIECSPAQTSKGFSIVHESSRRLTSWNVSAKCSPGWYGEVVVEPCSEHRKPFTLSGCAPMVCNSLQGSPPEGYVVTDETSLTVHSFGVKATCAAGYHGTVQATPCSSHETSYTLTGCHPIVCASMALAPPTGYTIKVETSLEQLTFGVKAECAAGYFGTPVAKACKSEGLAYTLEGCSMKVCKSRVGNVPRDIVLKSEGSLDVPSFSVDAHCHPGYMNESTVPKGKISVRPCTKNGEPYKLEGCEHEVCESLSKSPPAGYKVFAEESLQITTFQVDAGCDEGYTGVAKAAVCQNHAMPYSFSGCQKIMCTSPKLPDGHRVVENVKTQLDFQVDASCKDKYMGTPKTAACTEDGKPYTVSGCEPEVCNAPKTDVGYAVVEGSLERPSFQVTATCAAGFYGTPVVTPCMAHHESYKLSGCRPEPCISPDASDVAAYKITEVSLDVPTFNVTAKCSDDAQGTASTHVCTSKYTKYSVQGCSIPICTQPSAPQLVGYTVKETSLKMLKLDVKVSCAENYTGVASVTTCQGHGKSYSVEGCVPFKCTSAARTSEDGLVVFEKSLQKMDFEVHAECDAGFSGVPSIKMCEAHNTSYTIGGCSKQFCVSPVGDAAAGYVLTESNLHRAPNMFSVTAQCAAGYYGTPKVTVCKGQDLPYAVEGCKPVECKSPRNLTSNGYVVFENSKQLPDFQVKAECLDKFLGTPKVTPCTSHEEVYNLTGCEPEKCVMPSKEELRAYDLDVKSLERPFFSVLPRCYYRPSGEEAILGKVTECKNHLEPFKLEGCSLQCNSTTLGAEQGYIVREKNLLMPDFDVEVSCATNYMGTPTVAPCAEPLTPYTVKGCKPMKCTAPTLEAKKDYVVKETSLEKPSFGVSATCLKGGMPGEAIPCIFDGEPYTLKGCDEASCESPHRTQETGYTVWEEDRHFRSFKVTAACSEGYKGNAKVSRCSEAGEAFTLAGCEPKVCTAPVGDHTEDYDLTQHSVEIPTFNVGVRCKYGGTGTATVCPGDGRPYTLKGCNAPVCTAPREEEAGYVVVEKSKLMRDFEVSVRCADGYFGTPVATECIEHDKPYGLAGCSPMKCTTPDGDALINYELTESSLELPSFSVTTRCADSGTSAQSIPCKKDGQPYTLEGCKQHCTKPNITKEFKVTEKDLLVTSFDVKVECAFGYMGSPVASQCALAGEPYSVSGCVPEKCTMPSKEDSHRYTITVNSLERPFFDVQVKCRGAEASPPKAINCAGDGQPFLLEGCRALRCTSPRGGLGDGYVVYEGSLFSNAFDVQASCAEGYTGSAKVSVCTTGGGPYSLSGCKPKTCTAPAYVHAKHLQYEVTERSLEMPSFSVTVRCKGAQSSTPKAVPCQEDGKPYVLEGCKPLECFSPKAKGYVVHEGSRLTNNFDVTAQCATGYKGHAKVTMCAEHETPYEISGCEPKKCVEPREVEMTSYDLTVHSLEVPSFNISAKCKTKAKRGMEPHAIPCTEDGDEFLLDGCVPGQCSSPSTASAGYVVYEASMTVNSFNVTASCASGYKGKASVSVCKDVDEPYSLGGCEPEKCTEPSARDTEGYELTPFSLMRPSFSVSVKCTSGIGHGKAKECTKDGEPYTVEGCYIGECTSPRKDLEEGYVVYEKSKSRHDFHVTAQCATGYKGTPKVRECAKADEPYTLSGCTPETCVEPSLSEQANYDITIFSLQKPSFSVTARCKHGFRNATAKECTVDGGPFALEGCKDACASPKKAVDDGYTVVEKKLVMDEFTVDAMCMEDYMGTPKVTKCPAANQPYVLSGCTPKQCVLPSEEDRAAYKLTIYSQEARSFSITATCKNGVGTGKATKCTEDGKPFTLEGCPSLCTSPKKTAEEGYVVFERSMLMKDFNVGAMCADGYKGNATVTKCTSVNQPYSVSGCLPEKCTEPSPAEKANYNIITYSLERPSFSVTARCKSGKGTGKAIPCTDDKQPYKLEGCSAISG